MLNNVNIVISAELEIARKVTVLRHNTHMMAHAAQIMEISFAVDRGEHAAR